MRRLVPLTALLLLAGCVGSAPSAPGGPVDASAPVASDSWTVVSHLEPRGAMDVRFEVARPTQCRLAMFVQQSVDGGFSTEGHADLWVDGVPAAVPFMGTGGYSNWDDRAKAGPVDTRLAQDTFQSTYSTVVYGEAAVFATGIGFPEVPIDAAGRIVLSAMGALVDGSDAVNVAIGGSMMASIECGAPVTLTVAEDADAVWVHAAQWGGDIAVQTLGGGAEQGALDFVGDGESIEAIVGNWGGARGTLTFSGALEQAVVFDGLPLDVPPDQTFSSGPGEVHVEWTTARAYGNWWMGLSSWGPSAASVTAGGTYPF